MRIQDRVTLAEAYKNVAGIIRDFQELSIEALHLYERCLQHRSNCQLGILNSKDGRPWEELRLAMADTENQLRGVISMLNFPVVPEKEELIEEAEEAEEA